MKRIRLKVNSIKPGSRDYLGDYLRTLGIAPSDVFSFVVRPRDTDVDDPAKLNNRERAAAAAYDILSKGNAHVYVQPDPDTDGFTSSAVLIQYLKRRFPDVSIRWKLHEGKDHGINPDFVNPEDTLVFIPDAGSNDYQQQLQLVKGGHTVIILDHHEVENYQDTGAILVNNQVSDKFDNKYLSGVGIVYRFIKYRDSKYFADKPAIANDYLDLAATGIIADARNRTTLGNNFIAYYGLSHIRNQFLKEIIIKQARGIKDPANLSKIDVAFYVAPIINGVIRSGTQEDKERVFKALSTAESDQMFESEYHGVKREENLWQYAARLAFNAKSRQDAAKKKGFELITELIDKNGWDKHNLIIATIDDKRAEKINPNFTGLIARELVKKYNKPCLLLRATEFNGEELYGGSGRNGNFYGLPNLMDFLEKSKLITYIAGHTNAFGVFMPLENVARLRKYSDEHLNQSVFDDDIIDVDYWFDESNKHPIDLNRLHTFAAAINLYGNSIPQPKFAFTFPYSIANYRVMGKSQDSVKISYEGVDFVAFKDPSLIFQLGQHKGGVITLVGRPQINSWQGHESVQVRIDYIDIADAPKDAPVAVENEPLVGNDNGNGPLSWNDLI